LPEIDDADIGHFLVDTATIDETFADFGGLPEVIKRAQDLIVAPLKYRNALREIGAKTIKGVLFTGPPGTGKTMLARIIAREAQAVFYKISGPEIFSKWYGQSEEMLRKLFEHASRQPSAIIFFDEIDSVAGQRDEEAHEASKRVVAQLLTLMDGFKADSNVVVIATTNRPQDIDKGLLRPGRFDREIYFPLPALEDRELILKASARGIKTVDYLPHALIAEKTDSWSPAELAAIWTEAAHLAAADGRRAIMAEDYIVGFERVAAHLSRPSTASSKEAA
jgi:transitional endoplasmic reticulum ATPase